MTLTWSKHDDLIQIVLQFSSTDNDYSRVIVQFVWPDPVRSGRSTRPSYQFCSPDLLRCKKYTYDEEPPRADEKNTCNDDTLVHNCLWICSITTRYLEIHYYCWRFGFDWSLRRNIGTRYLSQPRHRLGSGQSHRQRKQQSGQMDQGGDTYQERTRQVDEQRTDEQSYQLSHIYDNLFAPNLSGERRLDRPFRRRLKSKLKRQH